MRLIIILLYLTLLQSLGDFCPGENSLFKKYTGFHSFKNKIHNRNGSWNKFHVRFKERVWF